MSLLDTLFGTSKEARIIPQLRGYETNYSMKTQNMLAMGVENPKITMETQAKLQVSQKVEGSKVFTSITTKHLEGKTESTQMKPYLEEALLMADIAKTLVIKRNYKGEALDIANMPALQRDWEAWKENRLREVFPEERKQQRFVKRFEKGLPNIFEGLRNSFQYMILLPECYAFHKHVNAANDATKLFLFPSKLMATEAVIHFELVPYEIKTVKDREDLLMVSLRSRIKNKKALIAEHLERLYAQHEDFEVKDYVFSLDIKYVLDRTNGKIYEALLRFTEAMHENLKYEIEITLKENKASETEAKTK